MQITIAGGCGDFGRSCFFVEGERHAFIVDAGTSTDGLDRMPDLTPAEIAGAEYLFITHSHRDHTGAIEYFENKGFRGPVLLTNQAFRQIHHKPENTMILDSTAPELELEPDFSFRWGRTGHCAGAVWYHVSCEGKKLFFSGDYRENDPFYMCDEVRGLSADVAVIDAAYGTDTCGADMRKEVAAAVKALRKTGQAVLFPVPRFGRGLSLPVYLYEHLEKETAFYLDKHLYDEWERLGHRAYFATPAAAKIPYKTFSLWDTNEISPGGLYFLTDAQLTKSSSRKFIKDHPECRILLTGSVHGYGKTKAYLESGRAELILWPNHTTEKEMKELSAKNHFAWVIPFHNPNKKPDYTKIIF